MMTILNRLMPHKQKIIYMVVGLLLISLACTLPGIPGQSVSTPVQLPSPTSTMEPTPMAPYPAALLEVWPQEGSTLGRQQTISFYFNQPMNHLIVEKALSFQPMIQGQLNWVDDASLTFTPKSPYPVDTKISVVLASSAASASGQVLQSGSEIHYQTSQKLKTMQQIPPDASENVDPSAPIIISFNQPIVPLSPKTEQTEPPAFSLEPPAEGKSEWINSSTCVFYPEPPLKGGTNYSINLRSDLKMESENLNWHFTTSKVMVDSIEPAADQGSIPLDPDIKIRFNQPMNVESVEKELVFSSIADKLPLSGTFAWNDKKTEVIFTPATLLTRNIDYTLQVPTSIKASNGDSLAEAKIISYRSMSPLALLSTQPLTNELIGVQGTYNEILLKFNGTLAKQSFASLVTISPEIGDYSVYRSGQDSISINGLFKPETSYRVKVSSGLKDPWNGSLEVPVDLEFKTSAARPSFSVPMLQFGNSVFLQPQDLALPVQAVNLKLMQVQSAPTTIQEYIRLSGNYDQLNAYRPALSETWTLRLADNHQGARVPVQLSKTNTALKTGVYYYHLSSSELKNDSDANFLAVVSHIQLMLKRSLKEIFVWAVDLNTNTPVTSQALLLLDKNGTTIARCTTDMGGKCVFDLPKESQDPSLNGFCAVMGQPGEEKFALSNDTWSAGLEGFTFGINNQVESPLPFVYLYTDRAIYRPGQTVNFRLITKTKDNGRYFPSDLTEMTVKVVGEFYSNGAESPVIATIPVTLSQYGSASGTFSLPEDASVGYYHFDFGEKVNAEYIGFKVAAYRKPQVDLQLKTPAADLKFGSDIEASGSALYYFGAPAAGLPVRWSLYAEPEGLYLPDGYQAGKYSTGWERFGDTDAFGILGREIASGNEITDIEGGFKIKVPASELNELDPEMRTRISLEATFEDQNGSQVSTRTSLHLHPSDLYIGVKADAWGAQAGSELGFSIQTVDWQEQSLGDKNLSASLQKMTWQEQVTISGSSLPVYPSPLFTEVGSVNLKTDAYGQARIAFKPSDPGDYRLEVRGEGAVSQIWTWVGGVGSVSWSSLPNQRLQISTDAGSYTPGQKAHIFIPNPLGEQTLALVTVDRARVMKEEVLTLDGASYEYELPISEDYAPNVYVSVTLLGKKADGTPDFRQGYQEIKVNADSQKLKVAVVAQPNQTQPANDVLMALQVKDSNGKPVQGEFSLSLVDKAVLALSDPNSKDIFTAFYGPNPLGIMNSMSLAGYIKRDSQLSGAGGKGGGGGPEPTIREKFKDTAFWNGNIKTDANGFAQIQLTLPDNLTTWVALVRGLSQENQVGEAETSIQTSKPLMIQPVVPRFAVVGDHLQLGALVYNNTADSLDVEVALANKGLSMDSPEKAVQKISIAPGKQERINWWAVVQNVPAVDLVFSAISGQYSDQSRPEDGELPVIRYQTTQTFSTTGMLTESGGITELVQFPHSFEPVGGELKLELSPSLAASVLDGIKTLNETSKQADNNEILASDLLPGLTVYNVLEMGNQVPPELKTRLDHSIQKDITLLTQHQNSDGGWGWMQGSQSTDFMSAYVLMGLGQAAQNDYSVNSTVMEQGRQYLQNRLLELSSLSTPETYNQIVFIQYALQKSGASDNDYGTTLADWSTSFQNVNRLSPWAQAMLALGLEKVQPNNSQSSSIVNNLMTRLTRVESESFWIEENPDQIHLSSPTFNTAVVVYALSQLTKDSKTLNETSHFLTLQRRPDGLWNSSYESAWALLALSEVMKFNNDLVAQYGFSVSLNNQLIVVSHPDTNSNLSTIKQTVPFSQLRLNYPNNLALTRDQTGGALYYRFYLTVDQPANKVEPLQKGLTLTRRYELSGKDCPAAPCPVVDQVSLKAIQSPVTVHLSLVVPVEMSYVTVEDTVPAGVEIFNRILNTTQQGLEVEPVINDGLSDQGWNGWVFGTPQIYDQTVRWTIEKLPAGTYDLTYQILPQYAGSFNVIPAHAYQIYYPDVEARSSGFMFKINE